MQQVVDKPVSAGRQLVYLECYDDAEHRQIRKDQKPQQCRQRQQKQFRIVLGPALFPGLRTHQLSSVKRFFLSIPFTSFVYILFIFVNIKLTLINNNVNKNMQICYYFFRICSFIVHIVF